MPRTHRLHVAFALSALALALPTPARAQPVRRMSLDDCVAVAAQNNPDARTSDLEINAATAARAGTFGELLPRVRLEGNVLQWDRPFEITFGPAASPPIRVRDAFTWTAMATVIQPVTGLFIIYDQYKVRDFGVDVAKVERDVARRDVGFRTGEAYLRLLEAERLVEVASTSVTQLEAQRAQAQSLYTNGVIGKNDLLRAELALANAKERVIQSDGQVQIARGRLATLMALPTSTVIEPVPLAGEPPPSEEPNVDSAQQHARERRLEIKEVAARTAQADARVAAARLRLLPQVSAVANYTHTEGSAFAQLNAGYAGATASWDVWDWGTNWHAIDEAAAKRDQAVVARLKLEDDLQLEARQAYVNAQTARAALDVARTAREQAEENYRIVSRRFEAAEATSFDVVDAEALLTQARARVETALYGYHVARIALQRATGGATPRLR